MGECRLKMLLETGYDQSELRTTKHPSQSRSKRAVHRESADCAGEAGSYAR